MVAKEPEDQPRRPPGQDRSPDPDPDLDERKPLYRDEVADGSGAADAGAGPTAGSSASARTADGAGTAEEAAAETQVLGDATRIRRGDDSTQILPRTQRTGYGARSDFDADDEDDLDGLAPPPGRFGARTRLALLVAAVAAVVVVGLGIGYVVLNLGDRGATSPGTAASAPVSPLSSSASPVPDPDTLLSDASMLSAAQAKSLDGKRTWKVALTQRGVDQNAAQPACLSTDGSDGQPPSQQTVLRLLSSSGKKPPGALHRADAYATPEEAAQAYVLAAKALGGCAMTGAYLFSGGVVSGLGDQAAAAVVEVITAGKSEFRSVVLNRTGRVLNVVDVAQPDRAVPLAAVATSLAGVTNAECRAAGGRCASGTTVRPGPPPVGGDQPGFLAAGDLPPVGTTAASWAGTVPAAPDPDFTGSGCETVSWAKVDARKRVARTYLLQDQSLTFGLDTMVLTQASPAAATALVDKVKADLDSCADRKLTASVSDPEKVSGTGAGGTPVTGWTATVSQKTTAGTAEYRVGIVSAGAKTVYTFLNPQKSLDLTADQWDLVTVRAGERATQVR